MTLSRRLTTRSHRSLTTASTKSAFSSPPGPKPTTEQLPHSTFLSRTTRSSLILAREILSDQARQSVTKSLTRIQVTQPHQSTTQIHQSRNRVDHSIRTSRVRGADSTQKVRRKIYSGRNAATLAAMRDEHQLDIRRARRPANPLTENVLEHRDFGFYDNQPDIQMHTDEEGEAEAPPVWVDLNEEQPDSIDELIAADKEKHQQQARHFNWGVLLKHLLPQFMKLRIRTKCWTTTNCYNDFTQCSKDCRIKFKRLVDLVDIHGQQRRIVTFCECTRDGIRLLQLGYLAGSPVKPQTAFSLPLLTFFDCLWNNCHMGAFPFTTALNQWLEPRSQRLRVRQGKHSRQLRKPFSAAVGLLRQLEDRRIQTIISALQLSKQAILASQTCPACFGPQPTNLSDYPANIRGQLCVCLDGNFQHRHQINASRDHDRVRTPQYFLSQTQVDRVSQEIRDREAEGMDPVQADRCTESHKAADDKRNETTWKGCDDTGLMGCCCRHDAAIHFANIYKSGEQRHFPMALIQTLLSEIEPNRKVAILYDIGCTMDKYIDRVIKNTPSPPSPQPASSFACTRHLDFHPRFNKGWGLSDGEGLERMWSYLSPLVSPLRYATRNHRLEAISHRLKHHNKKSVAQLSLWLRRKFNQAVKRHQETSLLLSELLSKPNPHRPERNYTTRFFKRQWQAQKLFHAEHTSDEMDRRTKLVEIYNREATLEHMRTRLRSPNIFLATAAEVEELLDSILAESDVLSAELAELTGAGLAGTGIGTAIDAEEEKLRLLLWNAKSQLFTQSVFIHAERQPLRDSHLMGSHLGTKGKENIIKGQQNRRPAVKKVIELFNSLYTEFKQKYPDQHLSDTHEHPLDYDTFIKWGMDHSFWNDGLYYHTDAPWSTNPDVQAGIHCILLLGRVQEEFGIIGQELARTVGWGVERFSQITETVNNITKRIGSIRNDPTTTADHIDNLPLGSMSRLEKLDLIKHEMKIELNNHGSLLQDWDNDIAWLWSRCQPQSSRPLLQRWDSTLDRIRREEPESNSLPLLLVEDEIEDAVLEVDHDDGEDVAEETIPDVGSDIIAAGAQ
ncbi:hypothetical protein MJO28_010411 [Puccinia striiformis f. sp. tritici]|uniref:Uncharacterized protein n=1 Tax=Puccinia striiformis f. sp. tritici TaxID=168172 RepID=A0ACC0E5Q6_9BASI|nr:hypothetical protein MJO28_010411 [Puccinia striiformis f. sp. tritici]